MIKKTTVRQPVTLTQVAEAAGVSIATVSRVLNRRGQVDEQTKLRVLDTVDELGYDASSIARKAAAISQADNKLYRVELLLCPLAEQKNMLMLDYFDEMLRGIQSYFSRHGNMMMNICTWDPAGYGEENDQIFNRLLSADGIIVIGNPTCDVVDRLVASRMKPVLISSDRDDISINSVEADNFTGGVIAARHLIRNGFKKIGFLSGSSKVHSFRARLNGAMIETLQELGPESFVSRVSATSDNEDVKAALQELFTSPDRPEALITTHPMAAYLAVEVLKELGLNCPQDCSIVTFDKPENIPGDISFTHLRTYPRQLGIKAAQRVYQQIFTRQIEDQPYKIVLPLELIPGNSVKMCAVRNKKIRRAEPVSLSGVIS